MAFADAYRNQVALLIRALPSVAAEECFAMKGGTAINLFIRDLPRLSVDIDLTYLPVQDRATSLADIDAAMLRIAERITQAVRGTRVAPSRSRENVITKLVVRSDSAQIKIEVTPVLRGCVFEPEIRPVSSSVEDEFGFAEMRIVSFPDLYAGKIVAAFDRQHPRDLFDARDLLANEGIDDALRRTFLVYLISHDRPMAEVAAAHTNPDSALYASCAAVHSASARLLLRAQAEGTARADMNGDDLFALMTALGWAIDQPSFTSRADHLFRIITSTILTNPSSRAPRK